MPRACRRRQRRAADLPLTPAQHGPRTADWLLVHTISERRGSTIARRACGRGLASGIRPCATLGRGASEPLRARIGCGSEASRRHPPTPAARRHGHIRRLRQRGVTATSADCAVLFKDRVERWFLPIRTSHQIGSDGRVQRHAASDTVVPKGTPADLRDAYTTHRRDIRAMIIVLIAAPGRAAGAHH